MDQNYQHGIGGENKKPRKKKSQVGPYDGNSYEVKGERNARKDAGYFNPGKMSDTDYYNPRKVETHAPP